jgi:hypothetical protein
MSNDLSAFGVGEVVRSSDGKGWTPVKPDVSGKYRVSHKDRIGFYLLSDAKHDSRFQVTSGDVRLGCRVHGKGKRPALFRCNMTTGCELIFIDPSLETPVDAEGSIQSSVFEIRRDFGTIVEKKREKTVEREDPKRKHVGLRPAAHLVAGAAGAAGGVTVAPVSLPTSAALLASSSSSSSRHKMSMMPPGGPSVMTPATSTHSSSASAASSGPVILSVARPTVPLVAGAGTVGMIEEGAAAGDVFYSVDFIANPSLGESRITITFVA